LTPIHTKHPTKVKSCTKQGIKHQWQKLHCFTEKQWVDNFMEHNNS
jgi:hypothetical protein